MQTHPDEEKKLNCEMDKIKSVDDIIKEKECFAEIQRKKRHYKKLMSRLLLKKESQSEQNFKNYEFTENEIINAKTNFSSKNVFTLSYNDLTQKNYNDEELKFYFYSLYKVSTKGRQKDIEGKIINNMNNDKVNFILNILLDNTYLNINNINNNIELVKIQIKYKYTVCSILINLLYDTEKYNSLFIDKFLVIYKYIFTLIDIYNSVKDISIIALITHYQWLINNLIQDKKIYDCLSLKYQINFLLLIQRIFNLNHYELYLNNIRCLYIFLTHQNDTSIYFQYKIFIIDIQKIIFDCIANKNILVLNESYKLLNEFLKSEGICKLLIEDKIYIKLLSYIINGFNNISYCNCCLSKLVKNDDDNLINNNYKIHNKLIDIIMQKTHSDKNVIKHTIKILRLIMNNNNGYNILLYVINNIYVNFFKRLQEIFFEKPNNLLIQQEIINFFDNFFDLAKNSIKFFLINNELHVFALDCLVDSYKEYLTEEDNEAYSKYIEALLNFIAKILKFGESDLSLKIKLKNICEEKDIYEILNRLNYSKNKGIYNTIQDLYNDVFIGYEQEE